MSEIKRKVAELRQRIGCAMDADKWIAVHPNGKGTKGQHALIG